MCPLPPFLVLAPLPFPDSPSPMYISVCLRSPPEITGMRENMVVALCLVCRASHDDLWIHPFPGRQRGFFMAEYCSHSLPHPSRRLLCSSHGTKSSIFTPSAGPECQSQGWRYTGSVHMVTTVGASFASVTGSRAVVNMGEQRASSPVERPFGPFGIYFEVLW